MWAAPETTDAQGAVVGRAGGAVAESLLYVPNYGNFDFLVLNPFSRQPAASWHVEESTATSTGTATLSLPASGVSLFSLYGPPVTVTLPGGVVVALVREPMSSANRPPFSVTRLSWLGFRVRLTVSKDGVTLAEGWWHDHGLFQHARLSCGYYITNGSLRVYAHFGHCPSGDYWDFPGLETEPSIPSYETDGPRATPFGRGISLDCAAPSDECIGEVRVSWTNAIQIFLPAVAWFAHLEPLAAAVDLKPTATPIAERFGPNVAWGRHRAACLVAPMWYLLSEIESAGHVEWQSYPNPYGEFVGYTRFVGASELNRDSQAAAVPSVGPRSNVSPDAAVNARLSTLRVKYDHFIDGTTGYMTLPLLGGAWNEYGTGEWTPASGNWYPSYPVNTTLSKKFAYASLHRVDATNLGAIVNPSDAVEVTRYCLRVIVAVEFATYATPFSSSWFWDDIGVVLPESQAAALLSGQEITIAGADYMQGTYPTPTKVGVLATLRVQAVG